MRVLVRCREMHCYLCRIVTHSHTHAYINTDPATPIVSYKKKICVLSAALILVASNCIIYLFSYSPFLVLALSSGGKVRFSTFALPDLSDPSTNMVCLVDTLALFFSLFMFCFSFFFCLSLKTLSRVFFCFRFLPIVIPLFDSVVLERKKNAKEKAAASSSWRD